MYRRVFGVLMFQPGFGFYSWVFCINHVYLWVCLWYLIGTSGSIPGIFLTPLDLELWEFWRLELHIFRGHFTTQMRLKTRLCLLGIGKTDDWENPHETHLTLTLETLWDTHKHRETTNDILDVGSLLYYSQQDHLFHPRINKPLEIQGFEYFIWFKAQKVLRL